MQQGQKVQLSVFLRESMLRSMLALLLLLSLSCSQVEKTIETHTTHLIDSGEPINDGLKVVDDNPVDVIVFKDWKAIGTEQRRLNGLRVVTPSKYRQLEIYAVAVEQLMADANTSLMVKQALEDKITAIVKVSEPVIK